MVALNRSATVGNDYWYARGRAYDYLGGTPVASRKTGEASRRAEMRERIGKGMSLKEGMERWE